MSDPSITHDADPIFEELVAYLDRELSESERQRVERRLAEDSAYREQLTQLQRTWDMLDSLPPATVTPSFTQTTVGMVALSVQEEVSDEVRSRFARGTAVWPAAATLILLAALFTYTVAANWFERPHRQLLADLPVIENLDAYRYLVDGDRIAFLQRLDEENLFNTTGEDGETALRFTSVARQVIEDADAVPEDDKQDLRRKQVRFAERSPAEQEQLRSIHAQLEAQPHADRLRAVLTHYNDWMSALPSTQRTALLALPEEQRFAETQRLLQAEEDKRFSAYVRARLTPEDQKQIGDWLRETLARQRNALMESIPRDFRHDWDRLSDEDQSRRLFWHVIQPGRLATFIESLPEADARTLVDSLTPEAQQAYRQQESPEKRREILLEWVRASVFVKFRPTFEQMKAYLDEHASPQDREYLENLPREQMHRAMGDLYMKYRRLRGGRPPFGRGPDARGSDGGRESNESRFDRRRGTDSRLPLGPRSGASPTGAPITPRN